MYNPDAALVTMEEIMRANERLEKSPHFVKTPMLRNVQDVFGISNGIALNMKLENTQITGSFKVRGVVNQMLTLPAGYGTQDKQLISMSAGNYGKAFAYITNQMGLKGTIIMPDTAPINRAELIRSYGVSVERHPGDKVQDVVNKHVSDNNMVFLPFDDPSLIAGYASAGLEILESVPDPDIVMVCCGGGGLVSGIASAIKLSCKTDCQIYAVEPEGSRTMHESYKQGKAVSMAVKSVASGLSPPFAGSNTFRHCQKYVKDVLLVSDKEIVESMFFLHARGLYVEPSGSAAFAALRHGKVPDVQNKTVVVVITGGNVTPDELVQLKNEYT